jgi:hypothetical protein
VRSHHLSQSISTGVLPVQPTAARAPHTGQVCQLIRSLKVVPPAHPQSSLGAPDLRRDSMSPRVLVPSASAMWRHPFGQHVY